MLTWNPDFQFTNVFIKNDFQKKDDLLHNKI